MKKITSDFTKLNTTNNFGEDFYSFEVMLPDSLIGSIIENYQNNNYDSEEMPNEALLSTGHFIFSEMRF